MELKELNLYPDYEIVETCKLNDQVQAEQRWISHFAGVNPKLFNLRSEWLRALRIAETMRAQKRKLSPEHIAKLRAGRLRFCRELRESGRIQTYATSKRRVK